MAKVCPRPERQCRIIKQEVAYAHSGLHGKMLRAQFRPLILGPQRCAEFFTVLFLVEWESPWPQGQEPPLLPGEVLQTMGQGKRPVLTLSSQGSEKPKAEAQ